MPALAVKKWVEEFVIGRNICPFAGRELANNRVRFVVSEATTETQLIHDLQNELNILLQDETIETTLLIHPRVLQDFDLYNEFLGAADLLLAEENLEGVFQVASFHPNYQFAGTHVNDAENYTNRSPYPVLHILRENSVEKAIASYPDVDQIPVNNIQAMNQLGEVKLSALLASFIDS